MANNDVVTITNGLATNADICRIFGFTDKTVRRRLAEVQPVLKKGVYVYYKLSDVLPFFVQPKNIEAYIRSMNFTDLPTDLSKEFWAGQRSRQIFEKEAGDLWPTNEVVKKVGESFKVVAMEMRLMADQVHRETGLTAKQRAIVEGMVDSALRNIQTRLAEQFQPRPEKTIPVEQEIQPIENEFEYDPNDTEL